MLKRLLLISVISIIALSCKTTYQLPVDLEKPTLYADSQINEPILIIQDIRWRIWANEARYLCGEINKKTYEAQKEKLFSILEKINGSS